MTPSEINDLSKLVVGAAIEVHRQLGPGLLEQTYQSALAHELSLRGINARCEVEIPFIYKGCKMANAFRADIIVEDEIILELKATEQESPLHCKQLLTYLRLANKRLGLLLNFNREILTDGLHRVANHL